MGHQKLFHHFFEDFLDLFPNISIAPVSNVMYTGLRKHFKIDNDLHQEHKE